MDAANRIDSKYGLEADHYTVQAEEASVFRKTQISIGSGTDQAKLPKRAVAYALTGTPQ